jgi:hypothetical protein
MLAAMVRARLLFTVSLLAACADEGGRTTGASSATSVGATLSTTLDGTDGTGTPATGTGEGEPSSSVDTGATTFGEGPSFDVGENDTTAGACVAVSDDETTCDGIDDDCNGFVDDIDVAADGICDCLVIALLGHAGSNPSSQFVAWLELQGTSSERIDPALVDGATLAPYDIVIIDELTRSYAPVETAAFADWVEAGGGLMSMTGHTSDPSIAQVRPNAILGEFGIAYQGALLNGPVTDFLAHPIGAGLTSVTFAGGFEVAETMAGTTDVVAQLPSAPIARAREVGDGKVFVWGDEWIEYDSEWSSMPEIHQLWVNALDWLRPADICGPPAG